MENQVHIDAARDSRLEELGLDEEILQTAVKAGELARAGCTDNDPRVFPGQAAWARTTRALRENLILLGWQRADEGNLPVVVNSKGDLAITVSSGDDGTGLAQRSPHTRNPKGTVTLAAIAQNRRQLSLPFFIPANPKQTRITWVLLILTTKDEVRCELSLPEAVGVDGRVVSWAERIILKPVHLDQELAVSPPENEPAVQVEVSRKSQ